MEDYIRFRKPLCVWVNAGQIFAEGQGGLILELEPQLAIELGRMLENYGAECLINAAIKNVAPFQDCISVERVKNPRSDIQT